MVKVVGTQASRSDLAELRSGMPLRLVHQPENTVDGNALLVLRADADPYAVRLELRQRPDVQECLRASELTQQEIRERTRAYAMAVPGLVGYLERALAKSLIGNQIRAGLWQTTIHSVPRFNGTLGVRLSLERVDSSSCNTDNGGVRT